MTEHLDPRSLQANERTLLAWIRTGLALMGFGFVIDRMALWLRYEVHEDDSISLVVGAATIALGAACQVIGGLRFMAMRRALIESRTVVPGVAGPLAAVVLVAGLGSALFVYLLLA